jgi:gliding motility-associated-like protein
MKIKLSCLRVYILCIQFLFFYLTSFSQVPITGFEIEGILVDGCDGGNEGKNEMVTFRNGPVSLDINDIRVDGGGATGVIINGQWPSNIFLGWCTTPAATVNISSLDAAITTTCGKLLEPPGGIIPPGGKVLIFTSTDFTVVPSYFANLTDTLYVVLQCAGNTGGHFANYNAISATRTLVLSNTATGFADTISYNRSLLLNGGGTPGSGDGAAVSYSWNGTASYFNNGCQAPFVPLSVSIDPISNADCLTNLFTFSGHVIAGNYKQLAWTSSGSGLFSAVNSLTTNYTPGVGELGTITITFTAVDYCDDSTFITQNITVSPISVADAGDDISICSGVSGFLGTTSTVGFDYSWTSTTGLNLSNVSNPTVTITNLTAVPIVSVYTVVTTVSATGCTATDNVSVTVTPNENASFNTTSTCTGGTSFITGTSGGIFTFNVAPADGASLNASTGVITGGISGTTYVITYLTLGTCPTNSSETITVLNQDDASFTTTSTCTGGTSFITGTPGGTFTFNVPPFDGASLNTSTGEITGGVSGTTYTITYITLGACPSNSSETITALNQDDASFNTTPTCTGGIAAITGTLGGTFTFNVTPTDGASLNASTGEISGGVSGTTYSLTYTTTGICQDVSSATVTSSIGLSIPTNISDDKSYCSFETFENLFTIPISGGTITWYSDPSLSVIIGNGNELAVENEIGLTEYYVTESLNGCESPPASISVTINQCDIVIPTAFTPNGDAVNDEWILSKIDSVFPENVIKIFNRWGNLLFQSSKGSYEANPWKGLYNGEVLPISSYYFIIEYNKEGKEAATGTVSIIQ